ncbi:phage antirepressor N-terminal domain-containing protein [Shewanella insulae]|uniref:phage antirepressor N-terminal domain-containing protein n=1 Tax=Shewanella insulae TaxID=2681496 RepID=UPI001EFEDBB4|nr:phage antirepressor N-terminal domain-containing protein [Shewanella insulae]MCG9754736.1 phage antirepressor N-terminal domain-containing protein [Shewanella insulae]
MNKTQLSLLVIGQLLLGLLLLALFLRHSLFTPANEPRDLNIDSFVDHAQYLTTQSEVIAPLLCAKLATDMGFTIDQNRVNSELRQTLKAYDDDKDAALYLFIYVKGYAFGLAHGIEDKPGAYFHLGCDSDHPEVQLSPEQSKI